MFSLRFLVSRKLYTIALGSLVLVLASGLLLFVHWCRLRKLTPACLYEFDLLISDAEIIDGSGGPPFHADVGISNKRIVCVGNLRNARGRTVIDAHGLTLAPGFIDVHTHIERNVPQTGPFLAPNFVRQGVTTVITGNCGRSFVDIGKFLKRVATNGTQVNIATLIGHNTVRVQVMKQKASVPSAAELKEMETLISRAMHEGA